MAQRLGALSAAAILIAFTPAEILNILPWNPIGIDALPAWVWALAGPLGGFGTVLISVLGVAAVVSRYRRGAGVERQQLRWFVAAVLLAVVPITVSPLGGGPVAFLLAVFGLLLVPVSVWIAVTRYRLYEIDRLISRGLSWAVLSGLLLAVYAGAILVLQSLLGDVIQGQTVAVAGSTLLAAALFQPLRRRVQVRGRPPLQPRPLRRRSDRDRLRRALRDEIDLASVTATSRASWTPRSDPPRSASGSAQPRPTTP